MKTRDSVRERERELELERELDPELEREHDPNIEAWSCGSLVVMTRLVSLSFLLITIACGAGCGSTDTPAANPVAITPPTSSPVAEITTRAASSPDDVLASLVQALRERNAAALGAIVDPVFGAVLWSTPGCCVAPVLTDVDESVDFSAPPFEPQGFATELVSTYDAAFPSIVDNADDYTMPPESELESAPPFASRDQDAARFRRLVAYAVVDSPAVKPQVDALAAATSVSYRLVSGYAIVHIVLIEREGQYYVAHVAAWQAYDA